MPKSIQSFQDLQVYQLAFQCSVDLYDLVDPLSNTQNVDLAQQSLAASHAVRAHIAAAWGQRRKRERLLYRLSMAQLEAVETQFCIEAVICTGDIDAETGQALCDRYRHLSTALDQLMETAAIGTKRWHKDLPAIA